MIIIEMDINCNDRFCNTYQHGLAAWMKEELGACYTKIEMQNTIISELASQGRMVQDQLDETERQLLVSENTADHLREAVTDITRQCVSSRVALRQTLEDYRQLRKSHMKLQSEHDDSMAQGKALAKALRAEQAKNREKPDSPKWISKKQKQD